MRSTSVRYIEKDTENGRIPIRNKKDTITGIMQTNSAKLHQCNEGQTPLRSEPLQSLLSKHDYDVWESFLRGEIDIPEGLDSSISRSHQIRPARRLAGASEDRKSVG